MFLQDLAPGQKVSIQVDIAGKYFEFPSSVITAHEDGVFLEPYEYRGSIVDFGAASPGYLFFHLHCMDTSNNERQVFKNINLVTKSFDGMKYYFASVRQMNTISFSDERRKKTRFDLQGIGDIRIDAVSGEKSTLIELTAQLINVSERGIAFLLSPDKTIAEDIEFTIHFSDFVMDKNFDITAKCVVVRTTEHEDKILYGCRFISMSEKMMLYLCFKSIEDKIAKREAQENANR